MKFSTREDISAPIEEVFAAVSNFEAAERAVLRRGAQVSRTDALTAPGVGMAWKSRFKFRGKTRDLTAELTEYTRPDTMTVSTDSEGLAGVMSVELVALSPRQTRLAVALELKPKTLTARLFLQSLRLAKSSLTRRFKGGVTRFARDLENRLGQQNRA